MNKFEKLAKLDIAYQLIQQVHSGLCGEGRGKYDDIKKSAFYLLLATVNLIDKIRKEIPDDKEICVARHTANEIERSIRDDLSNKMLSGVDTFSFDEVEHIVCEAVEEFVKREIDNGAGEITDK